VQLCQLVKSRHVQTHLEVRGTHKFANCRFDTVTTDIVTPQDWDEPTRPKTGCIKYTINTDMIEYLKANQVQFTD
jgi:hypothetical protein